MELKDLLTLLTTVTVPSANLSRDYNY